MPVIILHGLSEEKEREIIIRDNVELGDWDMDILANEWDADLLKDWGVDINWDDIDYDEIVETASEGSIKDYNGNTNYDEDKFIRSQLASDIQKKIEKGVEQGQIRPVIADILKRRAEQCTIFNFDEIIKFYRSEDANAELRAPYGYRIDAYGNLQNVDLQDIKFWLEEITEN